MENRFKFRAWSFQQKRMYYWSEIIQITNFGYALFVDNRALGEGLWDIQQSTGLKDINGVMIYEGDVVKFDDINGTVIFKNGCFVWDWIINDPPICNFENMDLEIIGNVHEIK